jgi:hypothetical protein
MTTSLKRALLLAVILVSGLFYVAAEEKPAPKSEEEYFKLSLRCAGLGTDFWARLPKKDNISGIEFSTHYNRKRSACLISVTFGSWAHVTMAPSLFEAVRRAWDWFHDPHWRWTENLK